MPGKFISFEGPEGSGKSTQAKLLRERLQSEGFEVTMSRDPGGTPVGEAIRNILQHDEAGEGMTATTEILLFEASRAAAVETLIKPALAEGKWVICDRFADSTLVYQGYGRGYDINELKKLNESATMGMAPDITFLLDVDVECGFARIEERNAKEDTGLDRMEREGTSFHERVRTGYLEIAEQDSDRCSLIDGALPEEEVQAIVWNLVKDKLLSDNEA